MPDFAYPLLMTLIGVFALAVVDWAHGGDLSLAVWRGLAHLVPHRRTVAPPPQPASQSAPRALMAGPGWTPDRIDALIAHVGRQIGAVDAEVVDETRDRRVPLVELPQVIELTRVAHVVAPARPVEDLPLLVDGLDQPTAWIRARTSAAAS